MVTLAVFPPPLPPSSFPPSPICPFTLLPPVAEDEPISDTVVRRGARRCRALIGVPVPLGDSLGLRSMSLGLRSMSLLLPVVPVAAVAAMAASELAEEMAAVEAVAITRGDAAAAATAEAASMEEPTCETSRCRNERGDPSDDVLPCSAPSVFLTTSVPPTEFACLCTSTCPRTF
jgi:hypothetical protein